MLKEYIYDNKFQLYIVDNSINILNYDEIISFSDKNIVIKSNNIISIKGNNLIITKMIDSELSIKGNIDIIEFR